MRILAPPYSVCEGEEIPTPSFGDTSFTSSSRALSALKEALDLSLASDQRLITIWDAADITGSPKLSRLFEAMKIDSEIPFLSLDSPSPAGTQEYLSRAELMNLCENPIRRAVGGTPTT